MQNPRLAYRYAKSLMDLAQEQNNLEPVVQDMQLLHATVESSPELAQLLRSPIVKADKKNAILQAIFGPFSGTGSASSHRLLCSCLPARAAKASCRKSPLLLLPNTRK